MGTKSTMHASMGLGTNEGGAGVADKAARTHLPAPLPAAVLNIDGGGARTGAGLRSCGCSLGVAPHAGAVSSVLFFALGKSPKRLMVPEL